MPSVKRRSPWHSHRPFPSPITHYLHPVHSVETAPINPPILRHPLKKPNPRLSPTSPLARNPHGLILKANTKKTGGIPFKRAPSIIKRGSDRRKSKKGKTLPDFKKQTKPYPSHEVRNTKTKADKKEKGSKDRSRKVRTLVVFLSFRGSRSQRKRF